MHRTDNLTTFISWNLGTSTSWYPQSLSRPVQGQLYLYLKHVAANGLCCYTFLTHASCIHMLYVLWQQSTPKTWNPVLMDFQGVCSSTPPFPPPSKHSEFHYLSSSSKTSSFTFLWVSLFMWLLYVNTCCFYCISHKTFGHGTWSDWVVKDCLLHWSSTLAKVK